MRGRPGHVEKKTLQVKMPGALWKRVMARGGSRYVRELIEADIAAPASPKGTEPDRIADKRSAARTGRTVHDKRLGLRLRRIAIGLSQGAVAKRLIPSVTVAMISYWESGERCPKTDQLEQLARILGCPVADLE
ncbi:MAG: helix-turn-helix domain-containing protein [Candidatus Xenobia bacterium]